jgi:thiol-disulfide isomerase/thioredoxin
MSKSPSGPSRRPRPASTTNGKNTKKNPSTTRPGPKSRASSKSQAGTRAQTRTQAPAPPTRFRSRHPVIAALVPVALVVAAIVTMVVIKAAGNSNPPASASSHLSTGTGTGGSSAPTNTGTTALSPQVVAALSVPTATLDEVGSPSGDVLPTKTGNGAVSTGADGKPLITYIGAEYCPYCAAERWAVAVALSRFGTFENLQGTHSSDTDVYPDTQTLSFYGSSYSSPYIDFQPVEEETNQPDGDAYQALQTPTAAENALVAKYDTEGSIPFLDIANRYVITGSSYSPQVLQGLSQSQIAADLSNPDSAVAQAIDGTANDITAAIAAVTGNQPSSVGSSATIAAIEQKLGA